MTELLIKSWKDNMAAKLIAEEGTLKGLVLSLEHGEQWVIGRDPDACQLLVEDPSASRKHLLCRTTPEGILVENLSSTNPVEVNNEEVSEPRLLKNGDSVKIGSGMFRFYADNSEGESLIVNERTESDDSAEEDEILDAEPEESKNGEAEVNEGNFEDSIFNEGDVPEKELPEKELTDNEIPDSMLQEKTLKENQTAKDNTGIPLHPENENTALQHPINPQLDLQEKPESALSHPDEDAEFKYHDSIYEDEPSDKHALAEINFGLLDTGRWLLKVIGGPNNGAEFSMQTGSTYVIGTDPHASDIVFHDTSVSRQHARISIDDEDAVTIEDLKSRNGTLVDGEPLHGKRPLATNTLVSMGTTSFIVYDREGEMQTIISPLLPSIVKVLQKEEPKEEETKVPETTVIAPAPIIEEPPKPAEPHASTTLPAIILIGVLASLFAIVGIGTSTLFKSEPVVVSESVDETKILDKALSAFPYVKYTFSKSTGRLLLVGHVLTATEKNQLLYGLQGYKFIKNLDDSGIIIDEYVWREINQVLSKNPSWKGITVSSPSAGHFVISGYLQTRSQAEHLAEYMSSNFPYLDLLEQKVIVDEEIISSAKNILQSFPNVKVALNNGEISLSGGIPPGKTKEFEELVSEIRGIHGVRSVRNLITEIAPEQTMVNISDKYDVTGFSNQGGTNLHVVINGRILRKGDILDGMIITNIQSHVIFLEKDGIKYRIDFSK